MRPPRPIATNLRGPRRLPFWVPTCMVLAVAACEHTAEPSRFPGTHGAGGHVTEHGEPVASVPSSSSVAHPGSSFHAHAASSSDTHAWHHDHRNSSGSTAWRGGGLSPLTFYPRFYAGGVTVTSGPAADGIFVLAEDPDVTAEVVASDDTVFWVSRGLSTADSIVSVPVGGGLATTLYRCSGEGVAIVSLARDASHVYWVESTAVRTEMSFVKRMQIGSDTVESFLTVRGPLKQIVIDPPFLYSVDESAVRAVRLSDGTETSLGAVTPSSQGPALAAARGVSFWLGLSDPSTRAIMTSGRPGSEPTALSKREQPVTAMSIAGASLYWIEYGGPNSSSSLFVMNPRDRDPTRIFESDRLNATSSYGHALIASDGDGAFVMVDPSGTEDDGAIFQIARGAEPRLVVSGTAGPGGIATGGKWVIFSDTGAGLVVRVPK
jgi:hypothetical protein